MTRVNFTRELQNEKSRGRRGRARLQERNTMLITTEGAGWVEPYCSFARGLQIPHGQRLDLAEGVGFEPTSPVKGCQFSRLVHSTALPPLRGTRIARASYCKARFRS